MYHFLTQVPGVAENRPSVLRGDYLKASKTDDMTQPLTVYKGYVHRVELDSVKLGFSKKCVHLYHLTLLTHTHTDTHTH